MGLLTIIEDEKPPHECSEKECSGGAFDCYDWSKGSKAIIASDGEHGVVLQYIGGPLDYWLNEAGITDEFDGVEAGLWVWEGNIVSHVSYMGEHDSEMSGTFRKLDGDEIMNVRDGCDLWDSDDFRKKNCHKKKDEG